MLNNAVESVKRTLAALEEFQRSGLDAVVEAAQAISRAFSNGNKLLAFGNGGSAADAQHLACELINRFRLERPSLPGLALTTDPSVITSIGNDYSFDDIFSRQIKGLGSAGDVAVAISTSGTSVNVLRGLAAARNRGMFNIGFSGSTGGEMGPLCDLFIRAPSDETPRIQEVHAVAIHLICELVDLKLFGRTQ